MEGLPVQHGGSTSTPRQIPVVDYLVLGDEPHLSARQCRSCGALYFDRRNACAKCFAAEFTSSRLANTGRVRAFTFVHRVKRPFVSAIVDLDGGGVVKANLLGFETPEDVAPHVRVALTTFVVGTDDDGTEAIAFGYKRLGKTA
ncbi:MULTISPECIES: Zn-ribbon domain-containing OB-fold protein [unclassified Sphingomonas]|uniref:Zn-ribbon domain-containing OB-fold protein n=1 Tax=unclassified Sphingomonas TaxID=196159 RepID=UPI0006F6A30D|nr:MULTISPECIES: zinc ribbon domain-containing protein [unclassified Sphingomonas]KQX19623.1 hypothetical protein ASD17_14050 [Sphingomonas sp. Root1294]KQY65824.1 hypothetical protein ASD39_17250 [Sphingomonas sp. Root50]KRB94869.1 hypothetical protein ASE22_02805 [Sphingomonas sp. Root720]